MLTQANRDLVVETPLGPDVLLLTRFAGEERLSHAFQYDLEFLSLAQAIAPEDIVGKLITWSIRLANGQRRHFSGYVKHFAGGMRQGDLRRYRAEVVPWLWFLTLRTNCRIFQELTLEKILDEIFADYGSIKKVEVAGVLPTTQRTYCVQYRESDFQFVSRLLEEEGVYYWFEHSAEGHRLMLCGAGAKPPLAGEPRIHFEPNAGQQSVPDGVLEWEDGYDLLSRQYTARDFNFLTPTNMLEKTSPTDVGHNLPKAPSGQKLEQFDYPGGYVDATGGEAVVKRRMQEQEARYRTCRAATTCRTLAAGTRFTLDEFVEQDAADRTWLLVSVRQEASEPTQYASGKQSAEPSVYRNEITGAAAGTPYVPPRRTRKPVVEGPQTATVTGPSGKRVAPDKYGRVKVQFHWDREGKLDDQTSCWIRVSQLWASRGWGSVQHPWVGDEVIVDFEEGDPDRPIITGRVYNETHLPPKGRDAAHEGDNDGKPIEKLPFRNYIARDDVGNEIYFDHEDEKNSRIVLSNKTNEGENWIKMEDGRVSIHQAKDKEEVTVGNFTAVTIGTTSEFFVGASSTLQIGLVTEAVLGVTTSVRAGGFSSVDFGLGSEFFLGGKITASMGPEFSLIGSDSKFEFNEGGHTKKASSKIHLESNSGISAICTGPTVGQAGTNAWHLIKQNNPQLFSSADPSANREALIVGMSNLAMKPMGTRIAQWENPHQAFFKVIKPVLSAMHTVAAVPAVAATAMYSSTPMLLRGDLFLPMAASNAVLAALAAALKLAEKAESLMTTVMMLKETPKSEIFVGLDEVRLAMPGVWDAPTQLWLKEKSLCLQVKSDDAAAWLLMKDGEVIIGGTKVKLGNANDGVVVNGPLDVCDGDLKVDSDGEEEEMDVKQQSNADLQGAAADQGEE